jgi:hypothetical protein
VYLQHNAKILFLISANPSHFFALLTRLDEQQITHSIRQEIFQIISLKATEITVQNGNTDSENYTEAGIK